MTTEARIESLGVAIMRRRRRKIAFGVVAALLAVLPLWHLEFLVLTFFGGLYGSIFFFAQPSEPNFALAVERKQPGFLEVSANGVRARSGAMEVAYSLAEIEEGWIANHWGEYVVLQMRGGDLISARVETRAQADAVLAAAKTRADQRTLDVKIAASQNLAAWAAALAILIAGLVGASFSILSSLSTEPSGSGSPGSLLLAATAWVVMLALALRCVQNLLPKRLSVGIDGLSIRGGITREFIPYEDVANVAMEPRGVRIERRRPHKKRSRSLLLPCWGIAQQALYDRIRQAMSVGSGESAAEAKQKLLDREGVPFATWRERLRELGRGSAAGGYRSVSIDRDELAQVLESSSAPPARRIAAALALSGASIPEVRARVRAVVDACANEDLRVAMERAAEGELDEEELQRALGPQKLRG